MLSCKTGMYDGTSIPPFIYSSNSHMIPLSILTFCSSILICLFDILSFIYNLFMHFLSLFSALNIFISKRKIQVGHTYSSTLLVFLSSTQLRPWLFIVHKLYSLIFRQPPFFTLTFHLVCCCIKNLNVGWWEGQRVKTSGFLGLRFQSHALSAEIPMRDKEKIFVFLNEDIFFLSGAYADKKTVDSLPSIKEVFKWVCGPGLGEILGVYFQHEVSNRGSWAGGRRSSHKIVVGRAWPP